MRSTADCRCGLVVRPVRRCSAVSRESISRVTDVLPLVPATWMLGYAALRRPEQLHQRDDARGAGLESSSPATAGRADARPAAAPRSRRASAPADSRPGDSREPGQAAVDALHLFAGHLLAGPDLVDDGVGRLGQELLVARASPSVCANSFCAAARSFSSRRRSAATSTVPDVSSSTTTVPRDSRTSTDADGVKPSAGSVSQANAPTAADLGVQIGARRPRPAGQAPADGR